MLGLSGSTGTSEFTCTGVSGRRGPTWAAPCASELLRRASQPLQLHKNGLFFSVGQGLSGTFPTRRHLCAQPCPRFQVLGHRSIPGLFSTTAAGPSHAHAGSYLLTTQRLGLVKKIPQTQTAEATLLFRVKIKSFQNFALCLLSFQELLAIAKSMWLKQGSSITQLRRYTEVSEEGSAQEHREVEATTSLLAPAHLVASLLS